MFQFVKQFFQTVEARTARGFLPTVRAINGFESEFEKLTREALRERSMALQARASGGESLDALLPEAFALVREIARRTLGQRHFDEQLMGGIAMAHGKIAEMKTGEGKTLAATLPAYLRGLFGSVHIVTVNDYLAQRDAVWMGQVYDALGLRVACLVHDNAFLYDPLYTSAQAAASLHVGALAQDAKRDELGSFKIVHEFLKPVGRREAYEADIVYGTNSEFGFDYLRDNLVYDKAQMVQRGFSYAIIDEVDSILIDEARTPLIISAPDEDAGKLYREFAKVAPRLRAADDYTVDEKKRAVSLTEAGIEKVNSLLGRKIYEENNLVLVHHLEESLKAHVLFQRDKHYVVKNGEIVIVDEFTGRLMHGRRYSGGLHQALEAKEGVRIQEESRTYATITIQNYFRMYPKLAGMTGTAATSSEEFHKVYRLDVVQIPTHQPMVRADSPDKVFGNEQGKFTALVKEIKARHESGQPVLVGTISIEKNEYLSKLLDREGIPHHVLNAKNHEQEAAIIAQAGARGAVTVATNMAGRGVDILLGGNPYHETGAQEVKALGGLHVIGTERHEARRIDNQLRGRSGRQGDPGSSQFYVSLDDDLMRVFGSEKLKPYFERLGIPADEPIEHRFVTQALDAAQTKVEGLYFDIRKHVLEYDDVLNRQRDAFYRERRAVLEKDGEGIQNLVREKLRAEANSLVDAAFAQDDPAGFLEQALGQFGQASRKMNEQTLAAGREQTVDDVFAWLWKPVSEIGGQEKEQFWDWARAALLRVFDMYWMSHLDAMEGLRDSASLRSYGQHDPLVEYRREGHRMYRELFQQMNSHIALLVVRSALQSHGHRTA